MKLPTTPLLLTSAKLVTSSSLGSGEGGHQILGHIEQQIQRDTEMALNQPAMVNSEGFSDFERQEISRISKVLRRQRRTALRRRALRRAHLNIEQQKEPQDQQTGFTRKKRSPQPALSLAELASAAGLSTSDLTLYKRKETAKIGHWMTQFAEIEQIFSPKDLTDDPEAFEQFLLMQNMMRASASFAKTTSPLLQLLNPYGCHCNFETMPSPYTGEPVNEFDAACKVLQDGYRCIGIDDGSECTDNSASHMTVPRYMRQHDTNKLIAALDSYCRQSNPDNTCGYDLCMVEAYFVNSVFNLLQAGKRIDIKKNHRLGFDPSAECQARPDPVDPSLLYADYMTYGEDSYDDYYDYYDYYSEGDDGEHSANALPPASQGQQQRPPRKNPEAQFQENLDSISPEKTSRQDSDPQPAKPKFVPDTCCGRFPLRQPFNPGSAGQKDCCQRDNVANIFNTITHMCCPDGTARKLGEC